MQDLNDTTRLDHALQAIDHLDLLPIRFKIASKEEGYGWSEAHADEVEKAYRRFLKLRAMYPERPLAPTQDIDKFWHAHILDTRKYAADCEHIFGTFLHHYPYLGMLGDKHRLDEAADTLRELFVSAFSEEVPDNAAAWCGAEPTTGKAAAWCGVEQTQDKAAAWCGVETATAKAAAWCGVEPTAANAAAWCGVETAATEQLSAALLVH